MLGAGLADAGADAGLAAAGAALWLANPVGGHCPSCGAAVHAKPMLLRPSERRDKSQFPMALDDLS